MRKSDCFMNEHDATILLVDDEIEILGLIKEVLVKEGFHNILTASNGKSAIDTCMKNKVDAIVLDIMLPDIDGIEVCRRIREFSYCSILFLSSKNDYVDKIVGLSNGGDDYITKPFSIKELIYRIKAQLRRQYYSKNMEESSKDIITIDNLTFDLENYQIKKDNRIIELTAKEFEIIFYLLKNANRIISKDKLYEQVWGEPSSICDNTIMVHLRHLREKLEDNPSDPNLLVTVKGLGYKLINKRK